LAERFPGVPIAVTGVEDRQSGAHGTDESVDLGMLERAALAEALFVSQWEVSRIQDASTNPR
jgi:cysteinylglycine-S-conjugate dipeptidase